MRKLVSFVDFQDAKSSILTRNNEWMPKMQKVVFDVWERKKMFYGLLFTLCDIRAKNNSIFCPVWSLPRSDTKVLQNLLHSSGFLDSGFTTN
jgi:hypothetical protein